jgi:hypothetical protein
VARVVRAGQGLCRSSSQVPAACRHHTHYELTRWRACRACGAGVGARATQRRGARGVASLRRRGAPARKRLRTPCVHHYSPDHMHTFPYPTSKRPVLLHPHVPAAAAPKLAPHLQLLVAAARRACLCAAWAGLRSARTCNWFCTVLMHYLPCACRESAGLGRCHCLSFLQLTLTGGPAAGVVI